MTLVGLDGQPLFPREYQGFYIAGVCPVCQMPLFYHGGGTYVVPPTALGPGRETTIAPAIYPTCAHEVDLTQVEIIIPRDYDLLVERRSIDRLFEMWYTLYQRWHAAQEQLTEFFNERTGMNDETVSGQPTGGAAPDAS